MNSRSDASLNSTVKGWPGLRGGPLNSHFPGLDNKKDPHAERVAISHLACCLRACRPKTRKERLGDKVIANLDTKLDIRHFLKGLMMLKPLARHLLTPRQKLLMAY